MIQVLLFIIVGQNLFNNCVALQNGKKKIRYIRLYTHTFGNKNYHFSKMFKQILQLLCTTIIVNFEGKRVIGHTGLEGQQVNKFQLTYYYQNV